LLQEEVSMGHRDVRIVIQKLRKEGWCERPGSGSHLVFQKPGMPNVVVPTSGKELKKGMYDKIARDAGWK